MHPVRASLISVAVFLAFACQEDRQDVGRLLETPQEDIPTSVIPGVLNIKLSEELTRDIENGTAPADIFENLETVSITRLFPYDSLYEERQRAAGLHRWYTVKYNERVPLTKATVLLKSSDGVEIVEEVPRTEPAAVNVPFNDPAAKSYQWYLVNDGSLRSGFKKGSDINVLPVWQSYTAGSNSVIVAVIDTGVQSDHPDLNGVVIPAGSNGSKSFLLKNLLTPYNITPQNHGTHVAGIIGAINNNGIGVCGIAGGNDGSGGVRILDCQAIGTEEGESGYPSSAIVWAANHGAVIANNSWSNTYGSEDKVPTTTPSSYAEACDYFIDHAGMDSNGNQTGPMKGGVIFFSAGNKGWSKAQPAMYERAIAVGASGPAFDKASYSNYGNWVDICAPGGNYTPFGNEIAEIYSTKASGTYGFMQGTSMSCPVVSGIAALLVSHFGGPGFTNDDLKEMLLGGARYDIISGNVGPLVDALGSFTVLDKHCLPVDDLQAVKGKNDVTLIWTVRSYGDAPAYSYLVAVCKERSKLVDLDPFNIPDGVVSKRVYTHDGKVGGRTMANIDKLEAGDWYGTAIGVEQNHKYVNGNDIISFTLLGNRPPVVTGAPTKPLTLKKDDAVVIDMEYSDPDEDEISIAVERASVADVWTRPSKGKLKLTITGGKADSGVYTTKATLSDPDGGVTVVSVQYALDNNTPPEIAVATSGKSMLKHNESTIFTLSYEDIDNDELTISCEPGSPAGTWTDDGAGTVTFTIDALKAGPGDYTAHFTVSDASESAGVDIQYSILPNEVPVMTGKIDDMTVSLSGKVLSLDDYFADPDGDVLQYELVSWEEPFTVVIQGASLRLNADRPGVSTITIRATDTYSEPLTTSFKVRAVSDGATVADVYPTAVSNVLYIAGVKAGEATVKIYSSTGKLLYSKKATLDPLNPLEIITKSLAPGKYIVKVSSSSGTTKKTIIKI